MFKISFFKDSLRKSLFGFSRSKSVLLLGTVVAISAISSQAEAVSFVASRSSLNATDQVDWSTLGPVFDASGPPDPAVFLPSSFIATSQAGNTVQADIPPAATPGILPPFVFQTTPDPGIPTNFEDGDFILFTGFIPGPPPAIGNPGPLSFTFDSPVFGVGTQLGVDDVPSFTGTISAFDRDNQLLGSFSAPGTASLMLDNSALFLGVVDAQPSISRIELMSSVSSSAIGVNQLSLVTSLTPNTTDVPEPSSVAAIAIAVALGASVVRKTARAAFTH